MTHYSIQKAEIDAQFRRRILYAPTPENPETRQMRRASARMLKKVEGYSKRHGNYKPRHVKTPAHGTRNRRLITIDKAVVAWNMFTPTTESVLNGTATVKRLIFKEKQYHYTKGYRVRHS